jgi:protein required for attachment to host cells
VEGFVHPEARWTNSDLSSDSAGRSVDQHGALESRTSPKEHEAEKFAHLLAEHLKDMHNQQHFEALVLIAPPHFLGLLHKQLPKPLDKLVSQTLDKDLTSCSIEKIIDAIHA